MSATEPQVVDSQEFIPILDYEFLGDNLTVERKRRFIEAYRDEGSIYHAAQSSRVSRQTVYNWIDSDRQFSLAVEEAKEDTYDALETSVYKRAFKDNLLAMFYLKAHRPKFRDKLQVDVEVLHSEINSLLRDVNPLQLQPLTTEFISDSSKLHSPAGEESQYHPVLAPLASDQKE